MKYLAVKGKCSEDAYKAIATDVSNFMLDSGYGRLYGISRYAPMYCDGELYLDCRTSANSRSLPKNDYLDKMIEILGNYTDKFETFDAVVMWSGTDSKNGYFYRLYISNNILREANRTVIVHDAENKSEFCARVRESVIGDFSTENNRPFCDVYNSVERARRAAYLESINIDDIPVHEYKLYGMSEDDFITLAYELGYGEVSVDYDMGLPSVWAENNDCDCETIFARRIGVDANKVYAFTSDTDQSFPNAIMFLVHS